MTLAGINTCLHSKDAGVKCSSEKPDVTIQLVGGATPVEGRVEVIINGIRGTVCDDGWNTNAANVTCKSLGYVYGLPLTIAHFGAGFGPIWFDDVNCTGREKTLGECQMTLWGQHNCLHTDDAGVKCSSEKPDVTIQLVGGATPDEGRVEVIINGIRGTVCDDGWNTNAANVTCKSLGYVYGVPLTIAHFGKGSGPIWFDDVNCTGREKTLGECQMTLYGQHNCLHTEDAGVKCSSEKSAETVTVRLRDGRTKYEGNVVVTKDGRSGYICDDEWEDNDARVICRMLGFQGGKAYVGSHFRVIATLSGIILDDVQCTGDEPSLSQCLHKPWGQHDCKQSEYAGVACLNPDVGQDISSSRASGSIQCGKRPLMEPQRSKRDESEEKQISPPPQFDKIIGGMNAVQGEIPWQVGVRIISDIIHPNFTWHHCGGTILSEYWILSAAHCFRMDLKNNYVLRTGDFNNKVYDDHEQEFKIDRLIAHERYDAISSDYDMALIKIRQQDGRGIVFNDYVQPACLPESNTEYEAGMKCHISGWGQTSNGYPDILQAVVVPIISDSECNRAYIGTQTTRMFCAGHMAGHVDSCSGDSGGPLACDIQGKFTLLGVTSWGRGCAQPNFPGVYAKVKEFLPWIKQKMQLYSEK